MGNRQSVGGITNEDASLPSSHSMTEESRRDERQRHKTGREREGEQTEAMLRGRRV